MIEVNLSSALCDFVADAVKDFRFETKSGSKRAPSVIEGYLPPKRSNSDEDFPFVVIRLDKGSSDMGMTTVTASLIIGIYTRELDGYLYCMSVAEHIRLALCQMDCQTLDDRYQLEFPIDWENLPEQPYPHWQIELTTKWKFRTPQLAPNF